MITTKKLDETDRKILKLYCTGIGLKEIGKRIFISHYTVEGRIKRMKERFCCDNIAQLIWETKDLLSENLQQTVTE